WGEMNSGERGTRSHRVLHLLGPIRRSGAEMMLLSGADQFRAMDVEPLAVSLATADESTALDQFRHVGFDVFHLGGVARWRVLARYWRLLRSQRPDCVHVHSEYMSVATTL